MTTSLTEDRTRTTLTSNIAALTILSVVTFVSIIVGVRIGAVDLTVNQIVPALGGHGDPTTLMIVRDLRLPRVIQSALVGGALAVSGAVFQALLRNPLADPYILGVSSGAAVGAVATVVLGWAAHELWAVPIAAFIGAMVAITLVLRIAAIVGKALDTRVLLLAGVVVGAFFNAIILLFLTYADVESFRSAMFWMMGSNSGATWPAVGMLAVYLVASLVVFLTLARSLNLLAIGEDTAFYLGTSPQRTKMIAYGGASLLTAAAVSVSGVIGFVGLIVPHLVRLIWGNNYRLVIPASALLGATGVILADTLARTIARPTELPIGVVTVLIGGPFFIWLLRRSAKA
jgi:iron complex transport system permease protein